MINIRKRGNVYQYCFEAGKVNEYEMLYSDYLDYWMKEYFEINYKYSTAKRYKESLDKIKEELGYDAKPEQLIYCGQRQFEFQQTFHGKLFHDNQVSNVYLMWLDQEPEQFTLQKEEISEVRWMELKECIQKVKSNQIPNCIYLEELEMIQKKLLSNGI